MLFSLCSTCYCVVYLYLYLLRKGCGYVLQQCYVFGVWGEYNIAVKSFRIDCCPGPFAARQMCKGSRLSARVLLTLYPAWPTNTIRAGACDVCFDAANTSDPVAIHVNYIHSHAPNARIIYTLSHLHMTRANVVSHGHMVSLITFLHSLRQRRSSYNLSYWNWPNCASLSRPVGQLQM